MNLELVSNKEDIKRPRVSFIITATNLLPDKRDPHVISKMRHPTWYPIPYNRTKRYQSFINYALTHYQT